MNKRLDYAVLLIIFVATLSVRIALALSTPHVFGEESFFHLRQLEHIQETGKPFYFDELSYSGRIYEFSPIFDYLLALAGMALPQVYVTKIIPNIIVSFLIIIAYFIAYQITKQSYVSLLTAFVMGFIPIFFSVSVNQLTIYSVVLPLFALLIYFFIVLKKGWPLYGYIITLFFLSVLHPAVLIFMLGLIVYWILQKTENVSLTRIEMEAIIFSTFFILLSQWLLYHNLFLKHGLDVVLNNAPTPIIADYFSKVTWLEATYKIGEIPFFFGFIVMYRYLFKEKNKNVSLLVGFALPTGLLLWLRYLNAEVGMIFFGFFLSLLFCQYYATYLAYLQQTRFSRFMTPIKLSFFFMFLLTSVYPAITLALDEQQHGLLRQDLESLAWIREHTPAHSIMLSTIEEGHLITGVAKRRNVADTNYFLVEDADIRLEDVRTMWTTPWETVAVRLLNKYSVDYIYVTPFAKQKYGFEKLPYAEKDCFRKVYDTAEVIIYQPRCELQ